MFYVSLVEGRSLNHYRVEVPVVNYKQVILNVSRFWAPERSITMGICCATPELQPPNSNRKPLVRMCSSGNHFSNFADIGDKVVLFVDFGEQFKPLPRSNQRHSLGGATAGRIWPDQRQHDSDEEQYEVGTKMSNQRLISSRGRGTSQNLGWLWCFT